MVQKARRKVEKKTKEKAKRQRVVKKKKKKNRTLEYLQWLQDEVLEKEAALLEGAEGSQVVGSKHKEITARDKKGQQPSKKAKERQQGKYCRGAVVKIGGANPYERYISTRQNCLVYHSRWVFLQLLLFSLIIFIYSWSLACARYIVFKQQCVLHTNTNTLAIILTYSRVLSAIEKTLQELVEEYWEVRRSLQNLIKSQKRNMA